MTNEELAVLARGGSTAALLELWDQVRRLAWRFIPRWQSAAGGAGMEAADCEQVAFLALLRAVGAFDAGKGLRFSTYFTKALKQEFFIAAGIRTEKQTRDPLRYASSLDVPASPDAPEGDTLAELLEDPRAEEAMEGAALRLTVAEVLAELPEEQRRAVYGRYWLGLPVDRKTHDAALRALRHPSRSRRLRALG